MNEINPRAVIGGNQPPLAESLIDATAHLKKRADDLVASAGRAAVTDDDTAGKATLLAKMLKEHAAFIETAREERKKPFLEAGRTVDLHFAGLRSPLVGTDPKKIGGAAGDVVAMIDAYRRKKEAEAAEERRRLEEEARVEREKAEAALAAQRAAEERERQAALEAERRVREAEAKAAESKNKAVREKAAREAAELRAQQEKEAAAARERAMQAEIEDRKRREVAAELDRKAAEVKATPISSGLGAKASSRSKWTVTVDDLAAAIKHCRRVDEATIAAAVQQIYDRQVRAGVRELPGATVKEDSQTIIR